MIRDKLKSIVAVMLVISVIVWSVIGFGFLVLINFIRNIYGF